MYLNKKKLNYFFTAKIPMRLIAVFAILFLVSATILYFYDVLFVGLNKLTWENRHFFSPLHAKVVALLMALTIGLGVLAESAPTIWDKFIFWGQLIDNKVKYFFYHQAYFLDTVDELLDEIRLIFGRVNFDLQAIAIPTDEAQLKEEALIPFWNQVKEIKNICKEVNHFLENHEAEDILNIRRQELAKRMLDNFIIANLEMSARLEEISNKLYHPYPSRCERRGSIKSH